MTGTKKRPVTAAQAEARRNNGKLHSTGPRTEEGKQASSRNAVRHGLWAKSDPVVDTGIFGEDPAAFENLLEGLHRSFNITSPLMVELMEGLAGIMWRQKRIPAIEALCLQRADDLSGRQADRAREQLAEILLAEHYLRTGGFMMDEDRYLVLLSYVHGWAAWGFGEGWSVDDGAPATEAERIALVDHLVGHRWASWDEAADHAVAVSVELEKGIEQDLHQLAITRANTLMWDQVLSQLNRPEAHLSRERDRIIAQLRSEEARNNATPGPGEAAT